MRKRLYRFCLFSLVLLAVLGGIYYYQEHREELTQEVDGTFVEHSGSEDKPFYAAAFRGSGDWYEC